MHVLKSVRPLSLAIALALAGAVLTPALADDQNYPTSQSCLGTGRNHDQAYNNAYAQCRNVMAIACIAIGGRLTDVSVDTESDFDYGRGVYQVNLMVSSNCVKHTSD